MFIKVLIVKALLQIVCGSRQLERERTFTLDADVPGDGPYGVAHSTLFLRFATEPIVNGLGTYLGL